MVSGSCHRRRGQCHRSTLYIRRIGGVLGRLSFVPQRRLVLPARARVARVAVCYIGSAGIVKHAATSGSGGNRNPISVFNVDIPKLPVICDHIGTDNHVSFSDYPCNGRTFGTYDYVCTCLHACFFRYGGNAKNSCTHNHVGINNYDGISKLSYIDSCSLRPILGWSLYFRIYTVPNVLLR